MNSRLPRSIRGLSMKRFAIALALLVASVPLSAITVSTPSNGAEVTSPFNLVASTTTCDSVPAVSMGYSIDNGPTTIEATSFTASVSASVGAHILYVKCWGQGVDDDVALNITVIQPVSNISVSTPGNGAQLTSPFNLAASVSTCSSMPAVSMGYSIDNGPTTIEATSFTASVSASVGAHILYVKCWGQGVNADVALNINVIQPVAATPAFSPPSGQYTGGQSVILSSATPGATIYYTTDGSAPTTSSAQYAGPIPMAKSGVIEALATASGYLGSGLARADYVITSPGPSVPSNATTVPEVQQLPGWKMVHDPSSTGTSTGAFSLVSSPSLSGDAAAFDTSFTDWGSELYSVSYATDTSASNFLYDAEVWIAAGSAVANLEMDNNQVISNGDTVIYGFQCAGDTNTWDYTENAGTPTDPNDQWVQSNQPCNPADWTPNAWHHVQISYSRDAVGNVTYNAVWLDGVQYPINATVPSAFTLGWAAGDLLTNFQVDGAGSNGSSTLYLDELTIYRW
jgi:Chitobiase/beta-hexosaminidase C-terminal domain